MRKLALALLTGISVSLFVASSANAERTFVFKNGDVGCQTDPGDVPGFGAFALPKATQVLRAEGGGVLQCHGWLPGGETLQQTFKQRISCNGVAGIGRIMVTRSGRVNAVCQFPKLF
jgi:hypothetical protein